MTDQLLNLECSDIQRAFEILSRLAGIIDVNIYGNELHIVVSDAEAAVQTVRREMASAGVEVYTLERIPASIEDVFVSLSRKGSNL
jgi:ABC-2 type transport system ATP-binding protein